LLLLFPYTAKNPTNQLCVVRFQATGSHFIYMPNQSL
jgi:hypothetical protein